MKTDDLITALATDAQTPATSLGRIWSVALGVGAAVSVLLLFATLGPRTDLSYALSTLRFDFKFVATLALAVPALALVWRLSRPATQGGSFAALGLAPLLLLAAIAMELIALPRQDWWPNLVGSNARWCLAFVPIFSLPVLAALFVALRRAAPLRTRLTGFVAGLAAGGLGATVYAAHCTDDSPLFMALWYTLGVAIVAAIGAALGPRLLRW